VAERKEAVKIVKAEKDAKKAEKKLALEAELSAKRTAAETGDEDATAFVKKHDDRKKSQELASRVMKACSALKKRIGEAELAEHLEGLVAEHADE
jgi:hypothetical protein